MARAYAFETLVTEQSPRLTEMLVDRSNGDQEALNRLFPLVYAELRRQPDSISAENAPDRRSKPLR